MAGNNIPPEFISAIEKGFRECMAKGELTGHPVENVRVVLQALLTLLESGVYHALKRL